MSIRIQALTDYNDYYTFDILATWDNDPEIKSLITPGMNAGIRGILLVTNSCTLPGKIKTNTCI